MRRPHEAGASGPAPDDDVAAANVAIIAKLDAGEITPAEYEQLASVQHRVAQSVAEDRTDERPIGHAGAASATGAPPLQHATPVSPAAAAAAAAATARHARHTHTSSSQGARTHTTPHAPLSSPTTTQQPPPSPPERDAASRHHPHATKHQGQKDPATQPPPPPPPPILPAVVPVVRPPRPATSGNNVRECILLAVDLSSEHAHVLDAVKQSLRMLVATKGVIGRGQHAFGVAALGTEMMWLLDFTTDAKQVMSLIDSLAPSGQFSALNLAECLEAVARKVNVESLGKVVQRDDGVSVTVVPGVVRLVVVHSRSAVERYPTSGSVGAALLAAPGFYMDMVHIWGSSHSDGAKMGSAAAAHAADMMAAAATMTETYRRLFPDPYWFMHSLPPDRRLFQPCIASLGAHALIRPESTRAHYTLDSNATRAS
eukprot:m.86854 g.86854  ORF g.86854 m.86854 type:complete len:428 (-) comp9680_c0_seq1:1927-3210(-)